MLGLCLVAVFAFSALAAASASAAPEYKQCVKAGKETVEWKEGAPGHEKLKKKSVTTGAWENKECSKEDTTDLYRLKGSNPGPEGKYELEAVEPETIGFKGKGKGATFTAEIEIGKTEVGEKIEVSCKKSADAGTIIAPEVISATFTFEGCVVKGTKTKCGPEGKITSAPLVSEVFFANSEEKAVVELFAGSHFAEFECGTGAGAKSVKLYGFPIGAVTGDVNEASKASTLTFEVKAGKQEPDSVWYGGEQIGGEPGLFSLYTVVGSSPPGKGETHPEATVASVFAQKWTGAVEIET